MIKALERLFDQALKLTPTEVTELTALIAANTAAIAANNTAVNNRIDGLEVDDLADVEAPAPSDGMLLIYDSGQSRWESALLTAGANITVTNGAGGITIATAGASGSFTAASGEVVTVSNGIVTSIV